MRRPTAKSLVLDLLSSLRGGAMPVAALVEAGALFDIHDNAMRVAIARLLSSGQLARDDRGLYRLGAGALAVDQRVLGWRSAEQRTRAWSGAWWLLTPTTSPRPRTREGRARDQALRLLGFAELSPGLHLRPDNLRVSLPELLGELERLGLEGGSTLALVQELDAASDARARRLWQRHGFERHYRKLLQELSTSEARLERLPREDAMVESFLVGGHVIRELVLDPLLPDPLAPEDQRRALVRAMRRYDRLGRRAWASFMAGHDAPHVATPVHGERTLSLTPGEVGA